MDTQKLHVSPSPHVLSKYNTRMIMGGVAVALLPALIASAFIFGPRVLLLTGVTVAACVGFEYIWCVLRKKPIAVGDLSAVVTGLLLAFNLPPNFPIWMACIGAFVSIVIVKQLFGGIGYNFANPAIVGRIVLQLSFAGPMITYTYPKSISGIDGLASATPLYLIKQGTIPLYDLLLGTHGGVLGETCAIALIVGGLFLVFTKIISPLIPAMYLGGVFVLDLLLGMGSGNTFPVAFLHAIGSILAGGLLLGAFFMATDYTTSPFTRSGKVVYGLGLAIITVSIRRWGNSLEGVSYAILFMNLLVPYLNAAFRQKAMGTGRYAKASRKGANADG